MFGVQFMVFAPASILVDIIRLAAVPHETHGRGWLVFLQLLGMAAKVLHCVSATACNLGQPLAAVSWVLSSCSNDLPLWCWLYPVGG